MGWLWLGAAALLGFTIWAVVVDSHETAAWEAWCHSQGGRVEENTKTITTVSSNGKPGFGTETTRYCLTSDGRILGVR